MAAVLFSGSRSWTATVDGCVLDQREGMYPVPRTAPRLTLMGSSRPPDIVDDGPSLGGFDQVRRIKSMMTARLHLGLPSLLHKIPFFMPAKSFLNHALNTYLFAACMGGGGLL